MIRQDRPVAIVLDIGLPDMDGLDLCRRLRAAGDWTPVMFVTARDEDVDRILGLEMGADDYLVKPFNPRELVARVRAVLRRSAGPGAVGAPSSGRAGGIDPDAPGLGGSGVPASGPRTATRWPSPQPNSTCWSTSSGSPGRSSTVRAAQLGVGIRPAAGARTVDVHVPRCARNSVTASPIRTVRGVGYSADDR